MSWFKETPESLRLLDIERANLAEREAQRCQSSYDSLAERETVYCVYRRGHSKMHKSACDERWTDAEALAPPTPQPHAQHH